MVVGAVYTVAAAAVVPIEAVMAVGSCFWPTDAMLVAAAECDAGCGRSSPF